VNKARYLGVALCSGKYFDVDLRSAKSDLYFSFNSIFHSAASYQNELVALHLYLVLKISGKFASETFRSGKFPLCSFSLKLSLTYNLFKYMSIINIIHITFSNVSVF